MHAQVSGLKGNFLSAIAILFPGIETYRERFGVAKRQGEHFVESWRALFRLVPKVIRSTHVPLAGPFIVRTCTVRQIRQLQGILYVQPLKQITYWARRRLSSSWSVLHVDVSEGADVASPSEEVAFLSWIDYAIGIVEPKQQHLDLEGRALVVVVRGEDTGRDQLGASAVKNNLKQKQLNILIFRWVRVGWTKEHALHDLSEPHKGCGESYVPWEERTWGRCPFLQECLIRAWFQRVKDDCLVARIYRELFRWADCLANFKENSCSQ